MRSLKVFLIWVAIVLPLCFVSVSGADLSSPVPDSVLLIGGFLGGLFKGIKKAIGGVAGVVSKVASVIPGVGSVVAAGAGAVSAILGGGSVQTSKPQPSGQVQTQYIGAVPAPVEADMFSGLMKVKVMGIPIVPVAIGGVLLYFILKKKKG